MKQYCQVNDLIVAVDKGKIYDAKVLRVEIVGNVSCKYFIHYQAWARKFDCWVDEHLIALKNDKAKQDKLLCGIDTTKTKTNNKLPKSVAKEKQNSNGNSGDGDAGCTSSSATGLEKVPTSPTAGELTSQTTRSGRSNRTIESAAVCESDTAAVATVENETKKKRKVDGNEAATTTATTAGETQRLQRRKLNMMDLADDDDENFAAKLAIPFALKKHLVEEWGLVTSAAGNIDGNNSNCRLLKLPKPSDLTVSRIIRDFLASKSLKMEGDTVQVCT